MSHKAWLISTPDDNGRLPLQTVLTISLIIAVTFCIWQNYQLNRPWFRSEIATISARFWHVCQVWHTIMMVHIFWAFLQCSDFWSKILVTIHILCDLICIYVLPFVILSYALPLLSIWCASILHICMTWWLSIHSYKSVPLILVILTITDSISIFGMWSNLPDFGYISRQSTILIYPYVPCSQLSNIPSCCFCLALTAVLDPAGAQLIVRSLSFPGPFPTQREIKQLVGP